MYLSPVRLGNCCEQEIRRLAGPRGALLAIAETELLMGLGLAHLEVDRNRDGTLAIP